MSIKEMTNVVHYKGYIGNVKFIEDKEILIFTAGSLSWPCIKTCHSINMWKRRSNGPLKRIAASEDEVRKCFQTAISSQLPLSPGQWRYVIDIFLHLWYVIGPGKIDDGYDIESFAQAALKGGTIMQMITLSAHYDGERICLDEEFELEPNSKLIVTVLPGEEIDSEHESWVNLSGRTLESAYGDEEPEYSPVLLKEVNPSYEAR